MSLVDKTIKNVGFNFLATIGERSLSMIVRLVLFGLLTNEDIGLASLGLLVLDFGNRFRDLGFGQAVIYFDEKIDEMLDTSILLISGFSLILCLMAVGFAPWIGIFFNEPKSIPIIRIISLQIFMGSLASAPWLFLYKNLHFKNLMIQRVACAFLTAIISFIMAYSGFGVWSLILPMLFVEVFNIAYLWYSAGYKPRMRFNLPLAIKMFKYSKYIVLAAVISFLTANLDRGFVQKLLGADYLGIFAVAMTLIYQPISQPYIQIESVMFPTFSMIKDDIERFKRAYINALAIVCTLCSLISGYLFAGIDYFIHIAYEPRLYPAIAVGQILIINILLRAIASTSSPIFRSKGKPEFVSYIAGAQGVLTFLLLTLFPYHLSLIQICWILVFTQLLSFIVALYFSYRIALVSMLDGIKCVMLPIIAASSAVGLSIALMNTLHIREYHLSIINSMSFYLNKYLKIPAHQDAILGLLFYSFAYLLLWISLSLLINKATMRLILEKGYDFLRKKGFSR